MQQLSLLENRTWPDGAVPVWAALDEAQRAEVVAILARLIAQRVRPPIEAMDPDPAELDHE